MFFLAVVDKLFLVYTIMLIARIFASWVPEWRDTQLMRFLAYYTDPYLDFFRRFIPPLGMLDLSPMIALLCLGMIQWAVKMLIILVFLH